MSLTKKQKFQLASLMTLTNENVEDTFSVIPSQAIEMIIERGYEGLSPLQQEEALLQAAVLLKDLRQIVLSEVRNTKTLH